MRGTLINFENIKIRNNGFLPGQCVFKLELEIKEVFEVNLGNIVNDKFVIEQR